MEQHSYPPINSYAFLSNAHTAALIGPDLSVDWMCTPRFDGPSIFAAILDRESGGAFRLQPADVVSIEQAYVGCSLVLRSTVRTATGELEVLDALDVSSGTPVTGDPFSPGHILLRLVRATRGTVTVDVDVDARPDYARAFADWQEPAPRQWRTHAPGADDLVLHATADLQVDGTRLVGTVKLAEGQTAAFALTYDGEPLRRFDEHIAARLLDRSCEIWQAWSESTPYSGVARKEVELSASVLRGLAFDVTGAVLAAPTTSLPEAIGGVRNWDYRFTWHRDSSLVLLSMFRLGHAAEGERYLRFLLGMQPTKTGMLRPMAGIHGEQEAPEYVLEHLEGYAGSGPVRIGNAAIGQLQLDTYGHVLDAVFVYHSITEGLGLEDWRTLRELVDTVADQWWEPDHGLWEMRGPKRHFVNSRVMCWVALDRGIRLAGKLGDAVPDAWVHARDAIHAEVLEQGYDAERGAFTMAYGFPYLDSSVLAIPLVGFLPGDDPRVVSTLDALIEDLGEGGALLHRYDAAAVDDGVGGEEAPFLLCSFQMVSALVLAGRDEQAQKHFDELMAYSGPLGLWPEEMTRDGMALGNYPQAFTHLSLIEAALNLDNATREDALRAWAMREHHRLPPD